MLMTNGLGATIGTLAAGAVVEALGVFNNAAAWPTAWYIFAGYSLAIAIAFMILFKDPAKAAKTAGKK